MKPGILIFYLLHRCSAMLRPHWCKCGWRNDTCSRAEVAHLYSFSGGSQKKQGEGSAMGAGRERIMIPSLSELVTDMLLSLRCYGDGGREHLEGGKSRRGKWATNVSKLDQSPHSCFIGFLKKKGERYVVSKGGDRFQVGQGTPPPQNNRVVTAHPGNQTYLCCNRKQHGVLLEHLLIITIFIQNMAANQPWCCRSQ